MRVFAFGGIKNQLKRDHAQTSHHKILCVLHHLLLILWTIWMEISLSMIHYFLIFSLRSSMKNICHKLYQIYSLFWILISYYEYYDIFGYITQENEWNLTNNFYNLRSLLFRLYSKIVDSECWLWKITEYSIYKICPTGVSFLEQKIENRLDWT